MKSYKEFLLGKNLVNESIPRGMDKDIYDFVVKADKNQLLKIKKALSSEINNGTLTDNKYKAELRLVNSRLADIK